MRCDVRASCSALPVLEAALYSNPAFRRPNLSVPGVSVAESTATTSLVRQIISALMSTAASLGIESEIVLPATFDFIMSGLYAQQLQIEETHLRTPAIEHGANDGSGNGDVVLPYLWMCPVCIAAGEAPERAYLPDADRRGQKLYPRQTQLSRPGGRRIGDLGALVVRLIVEAVDLSESHFTAGGGHRGEFDLVMSNADRLILGEIKSSPLVAFPIVKSARSIQPGHRWVTGFGCEGDWAMFVGAASAIHQRLPLSNPIGSGRQWPLPDLLTLAADPDKVQSILGAWTRHLVGYVKFNAEPASTRWLRFGCGNLETGAGTERLQLRVDNTKSLPGIDRTDDIKKGVAQVMLFDRLKKGCAKDAIKTVLFGNLYAETHHEHYLKPLASLQLSWPNHGNVWLFDAIIAMSRNIINDRQIEAVFSVPNRPYLDDSVSAEALLEGLDEASED